MKKTTSVDLQKAELNNYGLDPERLYGVVLLEFDRGEFLCTEGQRLPYILIILSGEAKVFCTSQSGRRLLLCFYCSGGIIGDLELMTQEDTAQNSVQANTGLCCIGIPVSDNADYLKENVRFLNCIGRMLARKLNRSSRKSAYIILYPLEARICSYIDISCRNGCFHESLTDVAELLGTSYRHLMRVLNQLTVDGVLEKIKHGYIICNQTELKIRSQNFYTLFEKEGI